MSGSEALAEARRRWGDHGHAVEHPTERAPFIVWESDSLWHPTTSQGFGSSWEAAFADADRRAGVPA